MTRGGCLASLTLFAALLMGCSGAEPPSVAPAYRSTNADYLLSPLDGYVFAVPAQTASRLADGFGLLLRGDIAEARALADELIRQDPLLHPAHVLRAQSGLEDGMSRAAMEILIPIVEAFPEYRAARLALGRSAELAGDDVTAYGSFALLQDEMGIAARKALELRDSALMTLQGRVVDEVGRLRFDLAEENLLFLDAWAPDSEITLSARLTLADAEGDSERALEAIRALVGLRPDDLELYERRAALEVEVGDPRTGMTIFRELAEASPEDRELADLVAWSEFRWRVAMMPSDVQELVDKRELTRADQAVLLYWLFPEIRYGRGQSGRIATDILDHPEREKIVRVLNLGLMHVDPSLHRFEPTRPLSRQQALESLLELLMRGDTTLACTGNLSINPRPTIAAICSAAAGCRLIATAADCQPRSTVSGGVALEMIRRTQEALESTQVLAAD